MKCPQEERMYWRVKAEDLAAFGTTFPGSQAAADASCLRGVTIGWLIGFTIENNCWEWPTWRVVEDIVKPLTRGSLRRFADLEEVRATGAVGRADTFVSHCWGAPWGLVVAAVSDHADPERRVWLDCFAVHLSLAPVVEPLVALSA